MDTEKELNEKILKITMTIRNDFPELSGYLEEMPAPIQDENNPEVTVERQRAYYDSLKVVVGKYLRMCE